jgi:DNA-binding response OmpR family regulator
MSIDSSTQPNKHLLVEDDLKLGSIVQKNLSKAGLSVVWVRSAQDALVQLSASGYQSVILDLCLPDGHGEDVVMQLRARQSGVAIIVTTAKDSLADRLTLFKLGADDYLVKPFSTDELVARIEAVVRRAKGVASARWAWGNLEYQPSTNTAFINGVEVVFTALEQKLFDKLVRNVDTVVSRVVLFETLWTDAPPTEGALDVLVSSLRKKIGAVRIKTFHGIGYRFNSRDPSS